MAQQTHETPTGDALYTAMGQIAAVSSRTDLLGVVNSTIKGLFSAKEIGFLIINDDRTTYSFFLVDICMAIWERQELKDLIAGNFNVDDPLFSEIVRSTRPIQYDIASIQSTAGLPRYAQFWKIMNIERVVAVPLRVGGETIGAMHFIVEKNVTFEDKDTLLRAVTPQLAVTISNILANEKIKEREQEKTRLLEFSNAMASVRDKMVLGKLLKSHLKDLFGIEDYVIHALSKDKRTHRPVLFDPDADFVQQPDFAKLIDADTDVNDGIFNKILASDDLIDFNVEEWFTSDTPPVYTNAAKAIGLMRMSGLAIKLGNENIAVMNFRTHGTDSAAIHRPLFKSICSQIAIALANIIANEEIERQLLEIERYRQQLEEEKIYLKREIEITQNTSDIVGRCKAMQDVFRLITQVAPTDSTVLLLGETGTGKELIARAIHNSSSRKNKLMIKVNCAALPANLIESELFGHERGSFTGASARGIGKFELANNSTLFLDEIGEIPLELQAKLLRALQEKEIERIGGQTTIRINIRIVAATNRNLMKLVEEGKFRADLFYRLNIFPIHLPSLRDRIEDIPELASYFIDRYSKKTGKKITSLSKKVLQELKEYDWPGNIRELEHTIERSILLADGVTIKDIHLPKPGTVAKNRPEPFKVQTIFEHEKEYILKVLTHVNGRISGEGGAAELLGIPPSTLNSRIKKLGIRRSFQG
ncbi:sigma 54-interacting transcriptional regulator [Chryseolinea sp. T2]|uniref:sigma-54-dependent Fis family transcriptional regulator n=1 Tax=Chryseolinea sp. T2 TaxID=3129255 RepID=UPI003077AB2C